MTAGARRAAALLGPALLATSLCGAVVVLIVATTGIQERSERFMGLSGMSASVATACAALALLGALLVVSGGRARWIATVALVPCALALQMNGATLVGQLRPERATDGTRLSLLVQNLWYENDDLDGAAAAVLDARAEVVVLAEYTPAAAAAFRAAGSHEQYPYRWEVERSHGRGIAVLSTVAFDQPTDLGLSGPGARIELDVHGTVVTLFAVHTNSPSSLYDVPRWISDFEALTPLVAEAGPNTVVAGDLNATSGHIRFRELARVGELRDAQDVGGGGFVNTWPVDGRIPALLRLDHVLVGPGLGVGQVRLLPDVGSDHRGLEAWLRVPAP